MKHLCDAMTSIPLWLHGAVTAAMFWGFGRVKAALDTSYAASNHPVDYAVGQTTFDATRIKGFYQVMQDAGTLEIYRHTQVIDFGFIALIAGGGLCLGTLAARGARAGSLGRRAGIYAAMAVMLGAAMDVFENLTSFVLLADPQGFAPWLAMPYSAFAVAKFALIALGMLGMILALGCAAVGRIAAKPKIG